MSLWLPCPVWGQGHACSSHRAWGVLRPASRESAQNGCRLLPERVAAFRGGAVGQGASSVGRLATNPVSPDRAAGPLRCCLEELGGFFISEESVHLPEAVNVIHVARSVSRHPEACRLSHS